jgi:hypothetical protein
MERLTQTPETTIARALSEQVPFTQLSGDELEMWLKALLSVFASIWSLA